MIHSLKMEFRKLVPEDQALVDKYIKEVSGYSTDYSVATIFLFQEFRDPEIYVGEKALFIKGFYAKDEIFFPPLCKAEYFLESLEMIKTYYKEKDKPYNIFGIQDEGINQIFKQNNMTVDESYFTNYGMVKNDEFSVYNDRDSAEYVYHPKDLINLEGNKYRKIREKVHAFYKDYHNRYEIVEYNPEEQSEIFELIKLWNEEKGHDYIPEMNLLKYLFEHRDREQFNIEIFILKIDKKMAGLTIVQKLGNNVGVVILEKSYSKYRNANCILNLFEANQLEDCKAISRQEDIGIKGLRQAKQSYKPFHMESKHELRQFNSKEFFGLYQSIFGDSDGLVNLVQNSETFKLRFSSFVLKNQKIVSIGAVREKKLRLFDRVEEIPFIFGIATKPEERKKGLAGEVLKSILNRVYTHGYPLAMIAPQEEYLIKYYEKFGFVKFNYHKKMPVTDLFKKNFNIQLGSLNDAEEVTRMFNEYGKRFKLAQYRDKVLTTERLKEVFVDGGKLFILSNSHMNYGYIICEEEGGITEYVHLLEDEPNEDMSIIKNILTNKGYEYILDCKYVNAPASAEECDIEKDTYSLIRIVNPKEFMMEYDHSIYFNDHSNFNKNITVKDSLVEDCFFNIKKDGKEIKFSMIPDQDKEATNIEITVSSLLQTILNNFIVNNDENYPIQNKILFCENW